MGAIETRTFKSGNSVAVRLPKELGIPAGTRLKIERTANGITIQPTTDADEEKRELLEMLAEIRQIWMKAGGPPKPQPRESIEFPDRPGLY